MEIRKQIGISKFECHCQKKNDGSVTNLNLQKKRFDNFVKKKFKKNCYLTSNVLARKVGKNCTRYCLTLDHVLSSKMCLLIFKNSESTGSSKTFTFKPNPVSPTTSAVNILANSFAFIPIECCSCKYFRNFPPTFVIVLKVDFILPLVNSGVVCDLALFHSSSLKKNGFLANSGSFLASKLIPLFKKCLESFIKTFFINSVSVNNNAGWRAANVPT